MSIRLIHSLKSPVHSNGRRARRMEHYDPSGEIATTRFAQCNASEFDPHVVVVDKSPQASLQALPFPPSDERLGTVRGGKNTKGKGKKGTIPSGRRGKVEHWVPAIWIPDEKTEGCMRCGRMFGWRRRRHHCRLCGRCVCAACSGRVSDCHSVLME